jgi:hypothetical protein
MNPAPFAVWRRDNEPGCENDTPVDDGGQDAYLLKVLILLRKVWRRGPGSNRRIKVLQTLKKGPLTLLLSECRLLGRHLQSAFGPLSTLIPEKFTEDRYRGPVKASTHIYKCKGFDRMAI